MKKPCFPTHLTVAVIVASVFWLSLIWPWMLGNFLSTMLTLDERYSRIWEELGFGIIVGMFITGIPLGIHVGMLLTQKTVHLKCWLWRPIFTIISGFFAIAVTVYDLLNGGITSGFSPIFRLIYLLMVQLPPLLWFAYNLNARSLQIMLAHRRKRS